MLFVTRSILVAFGSFFSFCLIAYLVKVIFNVLSSRSLNLQEVDVDLYDSESVGDPNSCTYNNECDDDKGLLFDLHDPKSVGDSIDDLKDDKGLRLFPEDCSFF